MAVGLLTATAQAGLCVMTLGLCLAAAMLLPSLALDWIIVGLMSSWPCALVILQDEAQLQAPMHFDQTLPSVCSCPCSFEFEKHCIAGVAVTRRTSESSQQV